MKNFTQRINELVTTNANGEVVCNLTKEQRDAMNNLQKAGNTTMRDSIESHVVTTFSIAQAIEARQTGSTSTQVEGIFADSIIMGTLKPNETEEIPCAVAKASNVATADINEATVLKAYTGCKMSHSSANASANTQVRDDLSGIYFSKPQAVADGDKIVKQMSLGDAILTGTIFPQDIRQVEELNNLLTVQNVLSQTMVCEYLQSIKGSNEDTILTAYRNINASYLEKIFEMQYQVKIGAVDDSSPESVSLYNSCLADYKAGLGSIGTPFLSSETLSVGISLRKMSISTDVIWSNRKKMNKIKKFNNGSFYVSESVDTGMQKIPTTSVIIAQHSDQITDIAAYSMRWLENEVRLENGIKPINIGSLPEVKKWNGSLNYYELLGIEPARETALINSIRDKAVEIADAVIQRQIRDQSSRTVEAIDALLGKRG